jgi:glutathione synthase/RimK-type ligase-like ATP-grasp enzyme
VSVLIVTRSDDNPSIRAVRDALVARGERVIRLDTDHYPTHVRLTTETDGPQIVRTLVVGDDVHALDDVTAVWYRRFHAGARIPRTVGDMRAASVHESRRALQGTIAALPCFHLDPLESVRRTDHKELQLLRAAAHGLDIPSTLVSNDPDSVRAFFARHQGNVVVKMQHSFAVVREGEEHVVFTNDVTERDLADLTGLAFSPMVFQEKIAKAYELRVTVVGQRVFTARVDSAAREDTAIDWRRDGVGLLNSWVKETLPAPLERGLVALLAELGLNYGAADFVVTPEGRHVFLEVNAVGEYFWLDRVHPISDAIADVLTERALRNPIALGAWENDTLPAR